MLLNRYFVGFDDLKRICESTRYIWLGGGGDLCTMSSPRQEIRFSTFFHSAPAGAFKMVCLSYRIDPMLRADTYSVEHYIATIINCIRWLAIKTDCHLLFPSRERDIVGACNVVCLETINFFQLHITGLSA